MMDEEEECPQAELDEFLTEWRRELLSGSRPGEGVLGKRDEHHPPHEAGNEANGSEEEVEEPARKRLAPREPSPLLVLPAVRRKEKEEEPSPPAEGERSSKRPSSGVLLDTLIADLDEINTIPFFEVQLPREVALLIFSYLSPADICTCGQVSRSWLSLAEDNVLWCQVCHRMGYQTNVDVHGHVVWKTVVKEIVLRQKQELKNWKERICGLSEHQPDTEGVLLCADYCPLHQHLLAGYSSGAVSLWDLTSEEGPLNFQRGHTLPTTPTLCKVRQGWAAVASEQGALALYDCSTGSVVHEVSDLGHVVSIDLRWREDRVTIAAASNHHLYQPGVAAPIWCSDITVLSCHKDGDWETIVLRPPRGQISSTIHQLALLPPSPASHSPLLYSTQTTLTLHQHPSPPTHILTSASTAGSTVINQFDHTPHCVACGTSAWGYHIQLYDLQTGAHRSTLRGHGQPVTALNIHSSPANMLVSGSADRRVRVFDCRCSQPSLTLRGHSGSVISVQCDEWRVVSGGKDGMVIVWDQRMAGELWSTHERHPVAGCWFDSRYLVAAHIPERRLLLSPADLSRRQRGLLRVMDFSVDPLYYTRMLPSVCSSGYDEPSRSLFNLDLKLPYDTIT